MKTLSTDYGKITLFKVVDPFDFWCILDELHGATDNSFWCNRGTIAAQYREGGLYSLRVTETDKMYQRGAQDDSCFARCEDGELSFYVFPCFITITNATVEMIWVHPRIRRMGLGTKLVKLSGATNTSRKLEGSEFFWRTIGI